MGIPGHLWAFMGIFAGVWGEGVIGDLWGSLGIFSFLMQDEKQNSSYLMLELSTWSSVDFLSIKF